MTAIAVAAASLALVVSAVAPATAPPVAALPPGPTATVVTKPGELVAVALPHRSAGRTWRIARPFDGAVLNQVSEANVGANVVLVFSAVKKGHTKLRFALTRGETAKAFESRTFVVNVG